MDYYNNNISPLSFYVFLVLSDPVLVDLDQYDLVSLTDALRGFLQDLPTPIIPTSVYSELVYTAQGKVSNTATHTDALTLVESKTLLKGQFAQITLILCL